MQKSFSLLQRTNVKYTILVKCLSLVRVNSSCVGRPSGLRASIGGATTSRKEEGEERRGEAQQEREKREESPDRRRRGRENRRQREKERNYIGSNTRLHFNKREGIKFLQQFLSRKIACLFDVFHVFVCSFCNPSK